MEFFKSCGSGVITLKGWQTVDFTVTDIVPSDSEIQFIPNDLPTVQSFIAIESELRRQNYLMHTDHAKLEIWLFNAADAQGNFASNPPNWAKFCEDGNVIAATTDSGTFKASNLPSHSILRAYGQAQAQKAQAKQANNESQGHHVPGTAVASRATLYHHFISAFSETLAFQLAQSSNFTPISCNIFVPKQNSWQLLEPTPIASPSQPIGVSVYLTMSGTLVISTYSRKSVELINFQALDRSKTSPKACRLLLAPINQQAVYQGQCQSQHNFEIFLPWRQHVISWLECQGLQLDSLDLMENWLHVSLDASPSKSVVLWPATLCYTFLRHENSKIARDSARNSADHSMPPMTLKFQGRDIDPLSAAERWSQSSANRDLEIAERKQKSQHQADIRGEAIASSPTSIRLVNYGESHSLNGVYPTPPDALSSQLPASSRPVELPSSAKLQQTETSAMEIDEQNNDADAMDDLFEDMEEDDFGGNDITDADFSFFDQDDKALDDVEMNDGPTTIPDIEDLPAVAGASEPIVKLEPNDEKPPLVEIHNNRAESPRKKVKFEVETDSHVIQSLNPKLVFQRLFQGMDLKETSRDSQEDSIFAPMVFHNELNSQGDRYGVKGQFGFNQSLGQAKSAENQLSLPGRSTHTTQSEPVRPRHDIISDDRDSESDSSSIVESEVYQTQNLATGELASEQDLGIQSQMTDEDLSSRALVNRPSNIARTFQILLHHSQTTLNALCNRRDLTTNAPNRTLKFDRNFVIASQLITEQIVFSTLDLWKKSLESNQSRTYSSSTHDSMLNSFSSATRNTLSNSSSCNFLAYTSIVDTPPEQPQPPKSTTKPVLPKLPINTRTDAGASGNPVRFPTTFIKLRRNDILCDILPPAVPFWDTLGLGPASGPKNLSAYAVFPAVRGLESLVEKFISDLGYCYEGSKYGMHAFSSLQKNKIGWKFSPTASAQEVQASFQELCIKLGAVLAMVDHESKSPSSVQASDLSTTNKSDAFVVYLIYPFEDLSLLSAMASGLSYLSESYRRAKTPAFRTRKADLVFQILPLSLLAKHEELRFLENNGLHALAREIYERCPLPVASEEASSLPIASGSSIHLTEALPRKIAFDLNIDPPTDITHDPSHFHLGYARSKSGNWITVAFSDNTGKYQAVTSYCLTGSRNFTDIAKEIWQTTIEILRCRRVSWRLCIARVGFMPSEELEAWANLSAPQQPISLITLLTCVEVDPPLSILPALNLPATPPANGVKPTAQTPIETPMTQIGVSPEQAASTPAATPSENLAADAVNDPDSHLIDSTDDTWSIILGHRPQLLSTFRTEFHQTLSSALIVRVPPSSPTLNPFKPSEYLDSVTAKFIAVHLLFARNSAKTADAPPPAVISAVPKPQADNILREFLSPLRNLALLAKVRGLSDGKAGLVPWHVLMALKGVEGLDMVYGLERWSNSP